MIKARIAWAPSITLAEGMKLTHAWIKKQVDAEIAEGKSDKDKYSSSVVVVQVTDTLDELKKHH